MSGEQDESWRTPQFRQKVLNEIDEAINASGNPAGKSSQEMENQLFQRAGSKEEYLSFVAKVILHMREMNDRSMSANNPHLAAALSAGNSQNNTSNEMWNSGSGGGGGGQGGGGHMTMLQSQLGGGGGPGGGGMQGNAGGQSSMLQAQLNQPMNRMPMQHQIRMGGGQMMGPGVSQLQSQLNQPSQLHARLTQPSQLQAQLQAGMDGGGGMRMTMQPQQQVQQQGMMGSQLQNQLNQPPRPVNVQMGPGGQYTSMQMGGNVTVRPGGPMGPQGPRGAMRPGARVRMPAGMRGVQQMNVMGGRPGVPGAQMQGMPRQQQQMRPDGMMSMVPGGMTVNVGGSQPMNSMGGGGPGGQNMYSGPGGPGVRPGGTIIMGGQQQQQQQGGIDVKPPVSMMGGMQQGQMQGQVQVSIAGGMHMQRVPSPMVPSPAQHVAASPQQPQQMRGGFPGAPSPGGPQQGMIRPPHSTPEETAAYLAKIQQLSKFVEPLKRMMAKLGEDDTDKMIKMKKLLDILTNPNTTVPMDTLLKCENVLEKIVSKLGHSGPSSVPPPSQAMTPTPMAGPASVPPPSSSELQNSVNPPSNLPSLGSVPTPGGMASGGSHSQPGSVNMGPGSVPGGGGAVSGVPSVGAAQTAAAGGAGTGEKQSSSIFAPMPNLPNIMNREQQALFGPLLETIAASLKSPFFNHTAERTFGQCLESLFGPEIRLPERTYRSYNSLEETARSQEASSDDEDFDTDEVADMDVAEEGSGDDFERPDVPDALRREIGGKDPEKFTFARRPKGEYAAGHIIVECSYVDSRAPPVPPIVVYVPKDYPEDTPPVVDMRFLGYNCSNFLERVKADLRCRLKKLPERHSLSQILYMWELSVRHAAAEPFLSAPLASCRKMDDDLLYMEMMEENPKTMPMDWDIEKFFGKEEAAAKMA